MIFLAGFARKKLEIVLFASAFGRGGPRTNPFGIMRGKLQGVIGWGNFYPALRAKRDSYRAARRSPLMKSVRIFSNTYRF